MRFLNQENSFHIGYFICMTICVLALTLVGYVVYLLFYPFKVIVPNQQPYKVVQKTIRRGEQLIYIVDYCKYIDADATVDRAFIGSTYVHLPSSTTNLPTGCRKAQIVVNLPSEMATGRYHLNISLAYHVNPIRTITEHFDTEEFDVVQ